ncbi:MAG: hypothetical protein A2015_06545 [Spirochaetes bacterium GWF1_31_7]|nr:MAG: hypothetical protein A2Y30_08380 [Spirochaetes bacterium GWE1_32_154]OHD51404.1 MAG: hypothetical protein A2Y29_14765 [Spirochaetes bacterium GWE2_31_10]OHD53130.1 MAG: hypothetical protein A2015_06545 [Spirochaetes bacterium GWF1_31_7]OHD83075.1 MAG: hypothetical protein A2355_01770 [Spirochaetes bacterium RIFOXYB1_FULL_32_8]HBD94449.1 hypothetical protein [Spirochaetia bacterium]
MKKMMLLFPLLLLIIGCPEVFQLSFGYTVDKKVVKGGDIITVIADLPVFQSRNSDVKMPFSVLRAKLMLPDDEAHTLFPSHYKEVAPLKIITDYAAQFQVPKNIDSNNFNDSGMDFFVNHIVDVNKTGTAAYGYCASKVVVIDYENTVTMSVTTAKKGSNITLTSSKPFFNPKEMPILELKKYVKFLNYPLVDKVTDQDPDKNFSIVLPFEAEIVSEYSISFIMPDHDYFIDLYGDGKKIEGYLQIINFNSLEPSFDSDFPFKTDPENNAAFYRSAEMLTIEK